MVLRVMLAGMMPMRSHEVCRTQHQPSSQLRGAAVCSPGAQRVCRTQGDAGDRQVGSGAFHGDARNRKKPSTSQHFNLERPPRVLCGPCGLAMRLAAESCVCRWWLAVAHAGSSLAHSAASSSSATRRRLRLPPAEMRRGQPALRRSPSFLRCYLASLKAQEVTVPARLLAECIAASRSSQPGNAQSPVSSNRGCLQC